MSTQDKKIKVVSTADFDNNKIINAKIDASENEVIGVGKIDDVLVNGESVVENKIANVEVPTKLSELENDSDYATQNDVEIVTASASAQIDSELNNMSFNAVTNKAVTNGINNTKINFINDIVSTLPEATTLGQSILNTSNNKIYTSIYEKIIDPLYNVTGTLNIDNEGTITGFTADNYITFESGWWHYLFPLRLQMNLDGIGSYYYDVDIPTFTISRSDDNSVLFEMRLKCTNRGNQAQIIFTTYKRDGTVVESSDIKFTAVRNMYKASDVFTLDMSTVNSSYYDASGISITLTQNGKSIFNKIFKSLVSDDDPESDFYYNLGGFIKIINQGVSSPYEYSFKGIRKIYGFNSYISTGSYSPASKYKFAYNTHTIIWDDGVALETNKLLCDTTTNMLYRYNGSALEEISPNIDSQLSDVSENAVQNKVIDAALKAMKPVIVTDSGTTLPSASGYQLNDTFLNTTDKKIYKAEMTIEGYELNTDVTNEGITVDLQTGVASGFLLAGVHGYMPIGIMRSNVNILWKSPVTIDFHFKITETRNTQVIATFYQGDRDYKCVIFYIENDNKLYCTYTQGNYGPGTQSEIYLLADYQLSLNTEYFVRIDKNGTNVTTTISTQGYNISSVYEETINDVIDWYPSLNYSRIIYGYYNSGPLNSGQSVFSGDIYLADSVGNFLIPTGSMSWDSGTSILNSTGYIDKTNSILHYYESPDLISVGGGSGSSYTAGAGIDEEELAENNKIALKTNWVFRNNLYINENSSIPSNKITIDNDIFFEYVNYPDNIFIGFQYDGTNWKVNDNVIDLEDYGITIDSSYSLSSDDNFIVAGNYIANKNEFEVIFLEFANVFLNGLLLCENIDYTLETTEMGIKITFIDYTLKSTDRIQVL